MNEKVENLVLEQLRAIRGDIARLSDDMRGLRSEMMSVRHRAPSVELSQDADHADVVSIKDRRVRIERRLELVDE